MNTTLIQDSPVQDQPLTLPPMPRLADIIKEAREKKGWTQTELGNRLGIHQSRVSRFEKGENLPTGPELEGLAKELGIARQRMIAAKHEAEVQKGTRAPEVVEMQKRIDAVFEKLEEMERLLKEAGIDPKKRRRKPSGNGDDG